MQRFNQTSYVRGQDSLLKTHSVLRNTYILLGFTLLFSAACAWFAVVTQASFGSALITTLAAFGLLFVTSALRNSGWGILAVFAFTGCMGYSMGPMLNHFIRGYANGGQLIITALAGTGVTFFISSAYILITKKELSSMGKTLGIGMIVCLIAIVANIFLKMPAIQLAISTLLTFIATMLMMYDTSRIIHNGETNYIMATISLFIDIQMLFQNLLMLLGFTSKD
jgi:modulator of FtsH protease